VSALDEPLLVQRFHGGGSSAKGSFATTEIFKSRVDVREQLALPYTWSDGAAGNAVTKVTTIELPAGTRIWSGRAAPQIDGVSGKVYQGGSNQIWIDARIQDDWSQMLHACVIGDRREINAPHAVLRHLARNAILQFSAHVQDQQSMFLQCLPDVALANRHAPLDFKLAIEHLRNQARTRLRRQSPDESVLPAPSVALAYCESVDELPDVD
jgi:hypothetical protein